MRIDDSSAQATTATTVGGILRSCLCVEAVLYGFGAWTIGFWFALALGRGWLIAVPTALVALAGLVLVAGPPAPRAAAQAEERDPFALLLVAALVLTWPLLIEHGQVTAACVAAGLLLLRLVVGIVRRSPPSLNGVAAAVIAVGAGITVSVSWSVFVVFVTVVGLSLALWPDWPMAGARGRAVDPALSQGRPTPMWHAVTEWAVLAGLGGLLATWRIGTQMFNPDNTYYLNKAIHYSEQAWSFPHHDLMFGVPGVQHIPYGNLLSSYEPLAGALAGITGWPAPHLLVTLIAPLALVLLPFAVRYMVRGLGAKRAGLAGALAVASMLLMTQSDTSSLFVTFSLGKELCRMTVIPLVFGAIGHALRSPSRHTAIIATLASVSAIGLSPSLGMAATLVLVPFTAAAVASRWFDRSAAPMSGRQLSLVALPMLVTLALVAFAAVFQARSGQALIDFLFFKHPMDAWTRVTGIAPSKGTLLGLVILLGSVVAFPLVLGTRLVRRAGGLMLLMFFAVLFSPLTFDLIIDDFLGINHFAWRLLWAFPLAALIGLVAANLDRARPLGLLTVAAVIIGFGVSSPPLNGGLYVSVVDVRNMPDRWPWDSGIPGVNYITADMLEATPPGGRFLAPDWIEQGATALSNDRFPVYARIDYVRMAEASPLTPAEFDAEARRLLGLGINGAPMPSALSADEWDSLLDRAKVDTVCLAPGSDAALRTAVERRGNVVVPGWVCSVWEIKRAES